MGSRPDGQRSVDTWRRIALASWTTPVDPQIFGDIEVDAGALLAHLEAERARTGTRVTVTHLVGKALAHALATNPDVNVRLRRGRFVPRETVDVFFVVSVSDGKELSGAKVVDADRKSVSEVADELRRRVERLFLERAVGAFEIDAHRTLGDAHRTRILSHAHDEQKVEQLVESFAQLRSASSVSARAFSGFFVDSLVGAAAVAGAGEGATTGLAVKSKGTPKMSAYSASKTPPSFRS